MHLIENYSLLSASKISKASIIDKFFPLAVDKYITIHPSSKYQSKSYDWFSECLVLLLPLLQAEGISVVQIGTKEDRPLPGCIHTQGQTDLGQVAYLLKNSLLHLGVDSFPTHIASHYGKKIVCLYSNTYANIVRPYWSKPEDYILLEPDRKGQKPSFMAVENPKTINAITPESIVGAVSKLLNLNFQPEFKTILFGDFYNNRMIESVPDSLINISNLGIDCLIMRMDFAFDEQILEQQLTHCSCAITTDKPINTDLITKFKGRIREILYILKDNHDPNFVEFLNKSNINYQLLTYETGDKLNDLKFNYMDYKLIHTRNRDSYVNRPELLNRDLNSLYYKSNKFTLSKGKIYASQADWRQGAAIAAFEYPPIKIIDCPEFREEMESFYILDKTVS